MAAVDRFMGGDPAHGDAPAQLPNQHMLGQALVLRSAVAAVGIVIAAAIGGRFQAEMQGHVVDRATS